MSREAWKYKKQAEVAARQLGYSKEVQEQVSKELRKMRFTVS